MAFINSQQIKNPQTLSFFEDLFTTLLNSKPALSESLLSLLQQSPKSLKQLIFAVESSHYFKFTLARLPEAIPSLCQPSIDSSLNLAEIQTLLASKLHSQNRCDEKAFNKTLRDFRNHMQLRIILRDVNRLTDLNQTTRELSYLAEACIRATQTFHETRLIEKHGPPVNSQGEKQHLFVVAMGKLGGHELNLSSDIDLIFAYPDSGVTQASDDQTSLDNQHFFARLGQGIIKSLNTQTADGFAFRVDMRLRPYGQSGAIVSSFAALENYYQSQGREWERFAMVKARVLTNNACTSDHNRLDTLLRNFTYRKYIDFSVVSSLKALKLMIEQEVQRRKIDNDIKLSSGGIREIEFIAQCFQLVRGGREAELQTPQLMQVLPLLAQRGYLPSDCVRKLLNAYHFLRNAEHAIQAYADEQSHQLPADTKARQSLLKIMRYTSWEAFYNAYKQHRTYVARTFSEVFTSASEDALQQPSDSAHLWAKALDKPVCLLEFQQNNHETPEYSFHLLTHLKQSTNSPNLSEQSKTRLNQLVPRLLDAVNQTTSPTATLERVFRLVNVITRRSNYLLLLLESPQALDNLVQLCDKSAWVAEQLAKQPALLNGFLDTQTLFTPPTRAMLSDELRRLTLRIPEGDIEQQMEALRYFRASHALRVAACEITHTLPLMRVSDYLTSIAESIIEYVLQVCWTEMTARYGYPDGIASEVPDFIVVGYGKLGGIELGHHSDLDLVFIHNASIGGETKGARRIDNYAFYSRIGQKIIHFLTTQTPSGRLYEVDMRLRPSGNSGLLVTALDAFEKYQLAGAWTWEHQALVRARVITGNTNLTLAFTQLRETVLTQKRDLNKLKAEVINMRQKMREHLGSGINLNTHKKFHLKQDPGGIVDIEFMVQYAVLAWSHLEPTLVKYTDNIRILENLANTSLLTAQEVGQLIEAYKTYRSFGHQLTLQKHSSIVDAAQFGRERRQVCAIWDRLLT